MNRPFSDRELAQLLAEDGGARSIADRIERDRAQLEELAPLRLGLASREDLLEWVRELLADRIELLQEQREMARELLELRMARGAWWSA